MGYGDDIMATGLARGAKARGKRIAFGDGQRIIWGPFSADMFRGNPNIAPPGSERDGDIEWIRHHKGNRLYSHVGRDKWGERWVWHYEFRATPGEIFFDRPAPARDGAILIEPNVANQKTSAPNRQWPTDRYQLVADQLREQGFRIIQADYSGAPYRLHGAEMMRMTFRQNLDLLREVRLYIGPHGGLSHGAAAVDTPAVVLFGGWAPPQVVGYDNHENLTGTTSACGSLMPCKHCADALDAISVERVMLAAKALLNNERTPRLMGRRW